MINKFSGIGPWRRKILNEETLLHSEWDRRLGLCSLVAIGSVTCLASLFGFLLNNLFVVTTSTTPPLASFAFGALLYFLSAQQLTCISRKVPLNGLLYNLAYISNSELLAFILGWTQISDSAAFMAVIAQTLASFMRMLFTNKVDKQISSDPGHVEVTIDYLAIALIILAMLVMCFSLRVLSTISIVFLVVLLFTATSTTVVALLHNLVHLRVRYLGFPYGFDEIKLGVEWLFLGIHCLESLSFVSEESENPRKTLPKVYKFLSRAFPSSLFISIIAFFPFSYRKAFKISTPLPAAFDTINIFSARYLLTVGSVCGMCAALAVGYLGPSRVIGQMARDGLWPGKWVGKLYGKGGSPRLAVISAAFIALPFTLLSFQFLCSLIITSSILRQFIQSLLIYYHIYLNDENDSSAVPAYGEMERSRGSIKSNDSSLYSEINSDEDEHAIEKVWKVTAVGTDESLLRGSFKCYNSVEQSPRLKQPHNCLTAPCSAHKSDKNWHGYHVYVAEDQFEKPKDCSSESESTRFLTIHKSPKNAGRALTFHVMLSVLVVISTAIIRETPQYIPILPVFTLSIGLFFLILTFIWTSQVIPANENDRYVPLGCMLMIFICIQLILHSQLLSLIIVVSWSAVGVLLYSMGLFCKL